MGNKYFHKSPTPTGHEPPAIGTTERSKSQSSKSNGNKIEKEETEEHDHVIEVRAKICAHKNIF